jgi:hypothetical protein
MSRPLRGCSVAVFDVESTGLEAVVNLPEELCSLITLLERATDCTVQMDDVRLVLVDAGGEVRHSVWSTGDAVADVTELGGQYAKKVLFVDFEVRNAMEDT